MLRRFASPYLSHGLVGSVFSKYGVLSAKIEWGRTSAWGYADTKRNAITINPNIPLRRDVIDLSFEGVLIEGEQYFIVLLREIGHLKPTFWDPPEEWLSIKERLDGDLLGDPLMQIDPFLKIDSARGYLEKKEGETEAEYTGRFVDLQSWLRCGGQKCASAEEWAVEEFKKRREEIKEILKKA